VHRRRSFNQVQDVSTSHLICLSCWKWSADQNRCRTGVGHALGARLRAKGGPPMMAISEKPPNSSSSIISLYIEGKEGCMRTCVQSGHHDWLDCGAPGAAAPSVGARAAASAAAFGCARPGSLRSISQLTHLITLYSLQSRPVISSARPTAALPFPGKWGLLELCSWHLRRLRSLGFAAPGPPSPLLGSYRRRRRRRLLQAVPSCAPVARRWRMHAGPPWPEVCPCVALA